MSDEAYLLADEPVDSLQAYETQHGGGRGLALATGQDPQMVVEEVARSGLRGRGGAGFPTGTKWRSVVQLADDEACPVYLACNAAEGEPGTSKDRALIAANPYQLLEGVLIARYATGADRAYIGIKQAFTAEHQRLRAALHEVRDAGWTGAETVEIVAGPDEYLFGEEKAMLETIEGKLPMPRILPPYMLGLFATVDRPHPTVANNVETLCHIPHVLARGSDWFRARGTTESPGTMAFTVVGDVAAPGVYELPLGTSLRTLLVDIAGSGDIKAVYSGVSNPVITPGLLDLPMDFASFAEAGTGLGSGGFIVYDTSHCIVRIAATFAHFLAIESCGQCLACKLGTADIARRLAAIDAGEAGADDLDAIRERCVGVTDLARCGLPVGAQVLHATLEAFADEVTAHLGHACWSPRPATVPKIERLDADTGTADYDIDYRRKRGDWSKPEPDAPLPPSILTGRIPHSAGYY